MNIENKIPVHIGTFGHIDAGKTAIAAALSEVISTAGIDGHPQSKQRGITIDLGFTSFILDKFLVTLVDGPGHADLIRISASSIEIIDCALIVIDINKGPQVQTGEHIIMIESLKLKKVVVVLNKIDLFKGNIEKEVIKIKNLFGSTSLGSEVPVYVISAKEKKGIEELKNGILQTLQSIDIKRDYESDLVIPIDHYFSIKGKGAIITGTILRGTIKINQDITIIPINTSGKVKDIQIFRQSVTSAKAGDRVGINIKNVEVEKLFRGCYATNNPDSFKHADILEVKVNNNKLFKPEIHFNTQVHVTIGMFTSVGNIYPFYELEAKKIQTTATNKDIGFNAIIWLNEKVLISKNKTTMLLSRLDLPPTSLRILGSADLVKILDVAPILYKYKVKKGRVKSVDHPQGVIVIDLAQSSNGAKKVVGKKLEPPFSKVLDTFGTKGAIIARIESKDAKINEGTEVILKELRSFVLKKS